MKPNRMERGPWKHRVLIFGFSALLALLLVWLLGFVLRDIGRMPGPDRAAIEKKYVAQSLVDKKTALGKEQNDLERQVANQREIQSILRTSTDNSQQTMNQLLEMYRLGLTKGVTPSEQEQASLAESEKQFLENQKQFQVANQEIARLSERLRVIQQEITALDEQIENSRKPATEEYNRLRERHSLKVAALKLGFLVPLMFLATWMAVKMRTKPYAPLAYAAFGAALWRTGTVMHQHFPREYFKYIAIGAAIAIVLAILLHLIRALVAPKKDWLLKQYKEAYNKHLCPVCSFPMQGAAASGLRRLGRRGAVIMPSMDAAGQSGIEPYTCPSCGTGLFAPCASCGKTRHALLPYCEHCGAGFESQE